MKKRGREREKKRSLLSLRAMKKIALQTIDRCHLMFAPLIFFGVSLRMDYLFHAEVKQIASPCYLQNVLIANLSRHLICGARKS